MHNNVYDIRNIIKGNYNTVYRKTAVPCMFNEFARDNNCYYIAGDLWNEFDCYNNMESIAKQLDNLISPNTKLIFDNSTEANILPMIHYANKLLQFNCIDPNNLYLISSALDIEHCLNYYSTLHNVDKITCNIYGCLFWEFHMKHQMISRNYSYIPYDIGIKEKTFLCWNRVLRYHRYFLIGMLSKFKLLDKGYVSLAASDCSLVWNIAYPSLISKYIDNPEIFNLLESHKEGILNLPPLYLDKTDLVTNRAELDNSTDYLYTETYFSVVSETNYYDHQPGRFITEKTFKCIAQKHPFVLVTRPHSLDTLRSIGYKTFSPWIDESYDLELDDNKRLLLVLKEITRLSNLSTSELTEFLNAAREICLHNYNTFINKSVFITNLN
jgi:hypothetical protein